MIINVHSAVERLADNLADNLPSCSGKVDIIQVQGEL
jgi:hypothetical protein